MAITTIVISLHKHTRTNYTNLLFDIFHFNSEYNTIVILQCFYLNNNLISVLSLGNQIILGTKKKKKNHLMVYE